MNVELSKGGPPSVRVPNFENMSIDEARLAAADAHIHLGQIVWTPFGRYGPPRGFVIRQNPSVGNADRFRRSSSRCRSVPGRAKSGYLIRQVHATATIPGDAASTGEKSPTVRVEVRDETGTWNVYNAYAQPKQKLEFNLTVVGTAELDVYVNNELIDSTRLGTEPPVQEKQQLGPPPPGARPAPGTTLKGTQR